MLSKFHNRFDYIIGVDERDVNTNVLIVLLNITAKRIQTAFPYFDDEKCILAGMVAYRISKSQNENVIKM